MQPGQDKCWFVEKTSESFLCADILRAALLQQLPHTPANQEEEGTILSC